jgi:pentatricopeptide repeat protein
VITYSAAISACEKGGETARALQLLDEMKECGLKPEMITYTAAIQACAKGGDPVRAIQLFERVEASNELEANTVTYNAVLDAVCGKPARTLWLSGVQRGVYAGFERWGTRVAAIDLHDLSEGAADAAVCWWLDERVPAKLLSPRADSPPPEHLELITGWGKSRAVHQTSDVKARVVALLLELGLPTVPTDNPGRLAVAWSAYTAWHEERGGGDAT